MKMTARCETILDTIVKRMSDNKFISHEQMVAYVRSLIQEVFDEGFDQGSWDTIEQ